MDFYLGQSVVFEGSVYMYRSRSYTEPGKVLIGAKDESLKYRKDYIGMGGELHYIRVPEKYIKHESLTNLQASVLLSKECD